MTLNKKIKFLNQCKNNINKLNFYLDMSDSNISCGPCLVLGHYYDWCLKFLFGANVEEKNKADYFNRIVEKLDYKVVSNMEYEDIKNITAAYYSLGEIYGHEGEVDQSKVYFSKVIEVMEEFLKLGNGFQTHEIQQKSGAVLFEILMWARKSLADLLDGDGAMELYEGMITEEELLYLQKYYSIFKASLRINDLAKVNESIRAIMKVYPDYEDVTKEAAEYLIKEKDYSNALDIITEEYNRQSITHWINLVNCICDEAENLNFECTKKVIEFASILMSELKLVEWSNLLLGLYRNIKTNENEVILLLDYLKEWFRKVDYNNNDFENCSDSILVLNDIYEDIRMEKYSKLYLRKYEFDFTLFLMNVSVQNGSYDRGIEASTKLEAFIEIMKENKEVYDYVLKCKNQCISDVKLSKYNLIDYPWYYLYKHIDDICETYDSEKGVSVNNKIKNKINKNIIGVNTLENRQLEDMLNGFVGKRIFNGDKDFSVICKEECNFHGVEEYYKYEVLLDKDLLSSNKSIIMTSNKDCVLDLTDKNVILISGDCELRDVDITYIKHIISKGKDTRIVIIIDKSKDKFSIEKVNYNNTIIENIVECKNCCEILDLNEAKSGREILSLIIGNEPENVTAYRFNTFENNIKEVLELIDNDIKAKTDLYKKNRYLLKEAVEEYNNLIEDSNSNYEEFVAKVNKDMNFIGEYAAEKIAIMIPDVIEKNINAIDDIEDIATLKTNAEKIFSEAIEKWCNKNIYDILLEQFELCVSSYSKLYGFHEETVEKLIENRNNILEVYPEFKEKFRVIEDKNLEELLKEFIEYYDTSISSVEYKTTVIPNEKFLNTVADGIKVMFMKSEEKAETSRMKIKNQVIANKENIANILSVGVNDKLVELGNLIKENLKSIFKEVEENLNSEKNIVNETIINIDKEQQQFDLSNAKLYETINLLQVEVLKYEKQINSGVVYYKNKCFSI